MTSGAKSSGTSREIETDPKQSWRKVHDALLSEIESGANPPGGRLPSEQQIAARFGVSRTMVRRALLSLSQRGVIRSINGSGSVVTLRPRTYLIASNSRFRDTLANSGVTVDRRVLAIETIPADRSVADELRLTPGDTVFRFETVLLGDNIPLVLSNRFYPKDRCPALIDIYRQELSVTRALAALGFGSLCRVETVVAARLAFEDEAEHLEMAPNTAVLETRGKGEVSGIGLFEYNISVIPGHLLQLVFASRLNQ